MSPLLAPAPPLSLASVEPGMNVDGRDSMDLSRTLGVDLGTASGMDVVMMPSFVLDADDGRGGGGGGGAVGEESEADGPADFGFLEAL